MADALAVIDEDGNPIFLPNGRPSKRTPAVQNAIFTAIENGMPRMRAAELAGIEYETMRRWMVADDEFRVGVARARAKYLETLTGSMMDAALGRGGTPKDWKAAHALAVAGFEEYKPTLDLRKLDVAQIVQILHAQADADGTTPIMITEDGDQDI